MLKGRWASVYPDPRDAIPVLLEAAEAGRLHDRGEVTVTADEAAALQQAGYTAIIGAGRWPAPHIPLDLLRLHPSLATLARFWYGPGALDPPLQSVAPPRLHVEMTPAKRLSWRLGDALRDPDQRRLLTNLAGRPDGLVECRRFQRALHRLKTPCYNAALTALINGGLLQHVTHDGVGCFVLPDEIRRLLNEAGVGVRRAPSARAKREQARRGTSAGGTAQSGQDHSRRAHALGAKARRRYQPRPVPDRRRFPREWGRSMAAKRAGQARQRLCREAGVCATDTANAARRARRAEQERGQAAASTLVAYTAPVRSSSATGVPGAPYFSASSAELVATAFHHNQPLGRSERVAAERTRRRV